MIVKEWDREMWGAVGRAGCVSAGRGLCVNGLITRLEEPSGMPCVKCL